LRSHVEEMRASKDPLAGARLRSGEIRTGRFVWRCTSALVVVLANAALVFFFVADQGSPAPMQSALKADGSGPVPIPSVPHRLRPPTRGSVTASPGAIPEPTVSGPTAPTSSIAPSGPTSVITIPPGAAAPSTSLPTPPLPAPSLTPDLKPASAGSDAAANIPPSPNFTRTCGSTGYDDSFGCVLNVVAAIENARESEGLPPMVLPTNWTSLNPEQQLFVATDLERTARGLAPLIAVATALEPAAASGVAASLDPTAPPGFPHTEVLSNWAGNIGNPLEAVYYWLYDDGLGSPNIDCSPSSLAGCWGHRRNLLAPLTCNQCVMGGAIGTTVEGASGITELIVETAGPVYVDFTWAMELPYLQRVG
jgi:hypothetical protein